MKLNRALRFLGILLASVLIGSALNVAVTTKTYSESYPAVVCPPTLPGLNSQISLSSTKTPFQRLQNRTNKTTPVRQLRLPISKDSIVINSEGTTPVVWQSRTGSWAGGAVCTGPESSQWFVGSSADITTRARLIVINSGLSDAVVDIEAFTENGKQPQKTINVASKNYTLIPIDSLAPGDNKLAIHVIPRSGRINAYLIDEQGKGLRTLGGDLINSVASPDKSVIIAAIPNQPPKRGQSKPTAHTLRVLVPGDLNSNMSVEVLSADGVFIPVGFSSKEIAAGTVTEFNLAPNISATSFAVRITATEPVVASVKSTVIVGGRSDFVWSTASPELTPLTLAVTGLTPLIAFTGADINVSIEITTIKGKVIRRSVKATDFTTWRVPESARSISVSKVGAKIYAGALVSSVNGYGFFPLAPGSVLTKLELPDSNIRVLNP